MLWDLGSGEILVVAFTICSTVGAKRVVEGGVDKTSILFGGIVGSDGEFNELVPIGSVPVGISGFIGDKLYIFSGEVVVASKNG